MAKATLITEVTTFTDREKTYGRSGILTFTRRLNKYDTVTTKIHTKTWNEKLTSGEYDLGELTYGRITHELLATIPALQATEAVYKKPTMTFRLADAAENDVLFYLDWNSFLREAMGKSGNTSFQEAKADWNAIPTADKDVFSENSNTKLKSLIEAKNTTKVKFVLFGN